MLSSELLTPTQNFETPALTEQEPKERLEAACKQLELEALNQLRSHYPKAEFPMHNAEHSLDVANNAQDILRAIQAVDPRLVTDEDIMFVRVEALRHDIPQDRKQFGDLDYNPKTQLIERQRGFSPQLIHIAERPENAVVGNEQRAADLTIKAVREGENGDVFVQFTDEKIQMDIGATTPKEFFDTLPANTIPKHLQGRNVFTMTQPIAQECGIRGVALALADLKEVSGRVLDVERPAARAIEVGNNEFRELHRGISLRINEIFESDEKIGQLEPSEKAQLIRVMLAWKQAQEGFCYGQRADLENILANNPAINQSPKADEIKSMLRERYAGYEKIAQHIRGEYLTIASEIGVSTDYDGQQIPTFEWVHELSQKYYDLTREINVMYDRLPDDSEFLPHDEAVINSLKKQQEKIRVDYEMAKKVCDQQLQDASPKQFIKIAQALGYM